MNKHRFFIYVTDAHRLNAFTLSVGDSPDKSAQCADHVGFVRPGATVNLSCSAVGRYLTFRREGDDAYVTGLCEVVVIGRRHICKYTLIVPVQTSVRIFRFDHACYNYYYECILTRTYGRMHARTYAYTHSCSNARKHAGIARPRIHTRYTYNTCNIPTSIQERARSAKKDKTTVTLLLYIVLKRCVAVIYGTAFVYNY